MYTVRFTASDPEGSALTVVTPPVNDDWISCDQGPATDFTCDYTSSRYYDATPIPATPFQRTITYSVTDGTSTSTATSDLMIDIADGQTSTDVRITVDDDAIDEPTEYFIVSASVRSSGFRRVRPAMPTSS